MRSVIILVGMLALSTANTNAGGVERTCKGEFTDMRVIGLTLGDCDLNLLSENELKYVERVCGAAATPSSENRASKCAIKVLASPKKSIRPENHGYGAPLYRVQKVLIPSSRQQSDRS
jgi:hypothetical protein